jgi:hypothetical protein
LYPPPSIIRDKIKNEMGEACSTHKGDTKFIENFSLRALKGRDYMGHLDVGGEDIKTNLKNK